MRGKVGQRKSKIKLFCLQDTIPYIISSLFANIRILRERFQTGASPKELVRETEASQFLTRETDMELVG